MTTLSIFIPCSYRRLGPGQANNGLRGDFPIGLTRARAMCKPERDITTIKELADGSLMFSFGASHSSGNRRRATDLSSSHAEHMALSNIPFPRRMPSNFKRQSPIPISAVKKEGRRIRNRKQENTGAEKVQDNFDSENVTGETDNVNHSKIGYRLSQRSPSTYARRSPMSSPDDGSNPDMNKSSNSSVEDDIVALFRRIQAESTVSKENPGNNKKNSNISSKSMKSADSVLRVLRQYPDKPKEEIEEETNQKISLMGGYEKMATQIDSSRKQSKKSKEIEEEPNISLMAGYEKMATKRDSSRRQSKKSESQRITKNMDNSEDFLLSRPTAKFVHKSPIPLSAIKKEVRPVPGIQQSDEQNEGTSRDSEGTSASVLNGSLLRDSAGLLEDQPDDLSQLNLSELKKTAKSYGLKGYSKLKKAELLELLRNVVKQS